MEYRGKKINDKKLQKKQRLLEINNKSKEIPNKINEKLNIKITKKVENFKKKNKKKCFESNVNFQVF